MNCGILEAVCNNVGASTNANVLGIAFDVFCAILDSGDDLVKRGCHKSNIYIDRLRSEGRDQVFERQLTNENRSVRKNAKKIVHGYFKRELPA